MQYIPRHILLIMLSFILLSACTSFWQMWVDDNEARQGISSSLVDFLYPEGEIPPEYDETIPNLNLPLRVGLAFVPGNSNQRKKAGLSPVHKLELLEKVKAQFRNKDYIRGIIVVPDTYLQSESGFEGIEQLARLYNLDVMALVSYDQVAHSEDSQASILYWTIEGAYIARGSKNDVQIFVDTAVFDIRTRKLLLRAPGISRIEAQSTLVNSLENLRNDRESGFSKAMDGMVVNLDNELESFQQRIKQDKSVRITASTDY